MFYILDKHLQSLRLYSSQKENASDNTIAMVEIETVGQGF